MVSELLSQLAKQGPIARVEAERLAGSEASLEGLLEQWWALGLPVVADVQSLRWDTEVEVLSASLLAGELARLEQALPVEAHVLLESSNQWLLDAAAAGAQPPRLCFVECQTAGRGRRRRPWVARFGEALQWSALVDSGRPLAQLSGLAIVTGVAVASALHALGWNQVGLKWPNDLVVGGAKLGGILVESVPGRNPGSAWAVVGVGLNLQLPPEPDGGFEQPVIALASLVHGSMVSARERDAGEPQAQSSLQDSLPVGRNRLAAVLSAAVLDAVQTFRDAGLAPFLERYAAHDVLAGRSIRFRSGDEVEQGEAIGLAPDGALRVLSAAGERRLVSADSSVRLA